jgi:hypothetical protein
MKLLGLHLPRHKEKPLANGTEDDEELEAPDYDEDEDQLEEEPEEETGRETRRSNNKRSLLKVINSSAYLKGTCYQRQYPSTFYYRKMYD